MTQCNEQCATHSAQQCDGQCFKHSNKQATCRCPNPSLPNPSIPNQPDPAFHTLMERSSGNGNFAFSRISNCRARENETRRMT